MYNYKLYNNIMHVCVIVCDCVCVFLSVHVCCVSALCPCMCTCLMYTVYNSCTYIIDMFVSTVKEYIGLFTF